MTIYNVRTAESGDFPRIETLVAGMFYDLGVTQVRETWTSHLRDALNMRLGRDVGVFVAVDSADRPIALAVGIVDHRLPSPRRPTGLVGYVEWLATDRRHRRKGAARAALKELLAWFDVLAIDTVDVHASNMAHRLYTELGFTTPTATPLRRSGGGNIAASATYE